MYFLKRGTERLIAASGRQHSEVDRLDAIISSPGLTVDLSPVLVNIISYSRVTADMESGKKLPRLCIVGIGRWTLERLVLTLLLKRKKCEFDFEFDLVWNIHSPQEIFHLVKR